MAEGTATFVVVEVAPDDVDDASGLAWLAGAVGVEERGGGPTVQLRVAVDPAVGPEALVAALGDRWSPVVEDVATDGLLDAWREHATAVRAGRRLTLRPAWRAADGAGPAGDPLPADAVELVLDPGRAFGSGSHPSTRLALALLERVVRPGATVLDVGCGSGVLAIAAARLGASSALGVDVDPAAIEATTANAARNGVEAIVDAAPTAVHELTALADVVVANVLAATLVELAPALVARLAEGGDLVVAGLLDRDVDRVAAALDAAAGDRDLEVVDRMEETALGATWAALHLR